MFDLEVAGSHLGWDVDRGIKAFRGVHHYLHVD